MDPFTTGMGTSPSEEITPPIPPEAFEPKDLLSVDIEIDDDTVIDDEAGEQADPNAGKPTIYADDPEDVAPPFNDPNLVTEDEGGFVDPNEDVQKTDDDANADWLREQRVQERQLQQRIESEMQSYAREMRAEVSRIESETARADAVANNIENRIGEAQREMQRAIDDDDSGYQLQLGQTLQELRQAKSEVDGYKGQLQTPEEIQKTFELHAQTRQQELVAEHGPKIPQAQNEVARKWQEKNLWMADQKYSAATQDMIGINNQLVAEGWDANYDSFYNEIAKRLKAKHPNVPMRDKSGRAIGGSQQQGRPRPARQPSGPPVASARRVGGNVSPDLRKSGNGKTVVRLTAADKAVMKALGRDPSDKAFMQQFAMEKMQRLQEEAAMKRINR